jgi:adenylate cyclase class IV
MEEKKKQLSQILTDEDMKSISIFKNKDTYYRHKNEIFDTQKKLLKLNLIFMITLGIIIFFVAIINTIAAGSPLACYIAINISGEHFKIPKSVHTELQSQSLVMELFNIL